MGRSVRPVLRKITMSSVSDMVRWVTSKFECLWAFIQVCSSEKSDMEMINVGVVQHEDGCGNDELEVVVAKGT